jgi:serine/threonine protein kinase
MLRHPNVLSLFGMCLERGNEMIVTEFVDGMSLFHLLQVKRRFSSTHRDRSPPQAAPTSQAQPMWRWAIQMMAQCAAGMGYLHSRRILHRDLKSPNGTAHPPPIPHIPHLNRYRTYFNGSTLVPFTHTGACLKSPRHSCCTISSYTHTLSHAQF